MLSRNMKVIKEMSFLLKSKESFIDLQLNLLEVREPFNTRLGFLHRFINSTYFFKNEEDCFTYLNTLYRVVYDRYLFNSLSGLKVYMDTIPDFKDAEYYNMFNSEIADLIEIKEF
jgi:hypothetical protein